MYRLGYAVRSLADPQASTAQQHPSRYLAGLADAVRSCRRRGIGFYRIALPPTIDHAVLAEHRLQLAVLADDIAAAQLRIGVHLSPAMGLAHADDTATAGFISRLETAAQLLELLDVGLQHTVVTHIGSADGRSGLQRFVRRYRSLSASARRRLTVEHSGQGYSLSDLCRLAADCGVPVVFDSLHHQLHNPAGWSSGLALGLALATWPAQMRAEVHLSSQRSEAHLLPDGAVAAPRPGQHADFVRLDDAMRLFADARGLPEFDIMIEAKAGDLAVLRLRQELRRRAPTAQTAAMV